LFTFIYFISLDEVNDDLLTFYAATYDFINFVSPGIWAGMHTVRYFDGKTYEWVGISRQPNILGKVCSLTSISLHESPCSTCNIRYLTFGLNYCFCQYS